MILKEDLLEEKIFDASYHNEAIFDENLTNKDFQNCYFDHIDFQDISFEVDKPGVFGLLGTNGAGKTTTIRMLLGIIKKDSSPS